MPTPHAGDGVLTYTIGQVIPIGYLYFAPYVAASPQPAPGVKLNAAEPGAPWVKTGLLKDDTFNVEEGDPDVIEYRRGFHQRYYGEVLRKAGMRTITATIQEVEPLAIAALLGETVTTVASPAGVSLDVGTSELIHHTMLIVYNEALNDEEFHMYTPHVLSRFKLAKDAEFMVLNLITKLITFKNATNKFKDFTYYLWS
jgi:hypothetical protein